VDTLEWLKIAAVVLVFAAGVAGGLAPWRVAGLRRSEDYLGWGNAFAGGVLLAAGLIHLLGDSAGGFAAIWPDMDYPWAFTIAAVAFLVILGIERVAPKTARVAVGSKQLSEDPEANALSAAALQAKSYPYLLLLTLSIHSVIAGMALGAQSSVAGFLIIVIAILAHKSAAGFALGVSLHRIGIPVNRARSLIFGFAVMTPIGIVIGAVISALLDATGEQIFEALFDAIAAGTFLYIASLDIIREEFLPPRRDRWTRWVWAAFGLTLMAVVAIWV
jgi:zinc transporter 1/2/3